MNDATHFTETALAKQFDACRGQFETGLALINALVAGAERMRTMQLEAARETKAKQAEVAAQIAGAKSIQELLVLQAALISEYCMRAVAYWSKLAELARRTQVEMIEIMGRRGSEALKQAEAPVVQSSFDAAREASEAFMKALTSAYPLLAPPPAKKPAKAAAHPA